MIGGMKAIAVLIAVAACANTFALRPGALQGVLAFAFGFAGAMLALFGGFAYWWDGAMQPDRRSAVVMVSGLVTLAACLLAWLRTAARDEFR